MTPEQIIEKWIGSDLPSDPAINAAQAAILDGLRDDIKAAIAEAREDCAKILDDEAERAERHRDYCCRGYLDSAADKIRTRLTDTRPDTQTSRRP